MKYSAADLLEKEKWYSTIIVHVKRKNANGMESVMNAENITQNQNGKDHVNKRKKELT